jgi:hypothetical protein
MATFFLARIIGRRNFLTRRLNFHSSHRQLNCWAPIQWINEAHLHNCTVNEAGTHWQGSLSRSSDSEGPQASHWHVTSIQLSPLSPLPPPLCGRSSPGTGQAVGVRRRSTARTAMSLVPVVLRGGYHGSHLSLRLLGSRATKNDSRALVRSLSSFIGVCMPRAPPFCMGGAPFDPGNSLHPLSPPWLLQVDDNPLPLLCGPRTTWIPRVSVRVRPSFYLLERTVGSKDGRRDDSWLVLWLSCLPCPVLGQSFMPP